MFTNYDIDEIIFPRMNNIDDLNYYEKINCNHSFLGSNYNLYEYAEKMFHVMNTKKKQLV